MEQQLRNLEQEIQTIQQRNARVEVDKAWETSIFRKVSIALLTYIVNCTPKSGHVENVHFLFFGILLLEVLIMGIYE